jgi:hypothetical protein
MKNVLVDTSIVLTIVYALAGFFGYVTWVRYESIETLANSQNILLAPYNSMWILFA